MLTCFNCIHLMSLLWHRNATLNGVLEAPKPSCLGSEDIHSLVVVHMIVLVITDWQLELP